MAELRNRPNPLSYYKEKHPEAIEVKRIRYAVAMVECTGDGGNPITYWYHHETSIVTVDRYEKTFTLDCSGWRSRTTKDNLNRILGHYHIPASIYQEKGHWYYAKGKGSSRFDSPVSYRDGMQINGEGEILSQTQFADGQAEHDRIEKLNKKISSYCKGLRTKLADGPLYPTAGDCWGCLVKSDTGKTMGDMMGNDHLEMHLEESYFMGSLNLNALKEAGYNNPEFILQGNFTDLVVRAVRRYLKTKMGIAQ